MEATWNSKNNYSHKNETILYKFGYLYFGRMEDRFKR